MDVDRIGEHAARDEPTIVVINDKREHGFYVTSLISRGRRAEQGPDLAHIYTEARSLSSFQSSQVNWDAQTRL